MYIHLISRLHSPLNSLNLSVGNGHPVYKNIFKIAHEFFYTYAITEERPVQTCRLARGFAAHRHLKYNLRSIISKTPRKWF